MKRWEYQTYQTTNDSDVELTALGHQGWEAYAFTSFTEMWESSSGETRHATTLTHHLKREVDRVDD